MIDLGGPPTRYSSVEWAIIAAANVLNISPEEALTNRSRRFKQAIYARQLAAYWMRRLTQLSYPQIARELGFCDHTTAMYSEREIEGRLLSCGDFSSAVRLTEAAFGDFMRAGVLPFRLSSRPRIA